ncbi:hypothetical protein KEG38_09360 [Polyangium jinanense]|uniref:hypothetical protein n=1 Tax=Polyangium jinanense TaxID=2829994 RepID=UPI0023417E53|nr:hypothetical protein [Polyangium jinanense]MDC3954053.1 hypothetical protein [Polyangium jinanense]
MAEAKRVDFNALPREVRERLISCMQHQSYPYPLLSSVPSQGAAIAGWFVLALLGFIVVVGTLFYQYGRELQPMPVMFLYFLGTAIVFLSILFLVRRVRLGSSLPYKPGRFLFPMDFINAEDRLLRVVPMSTLVDFRGVHQHTNGIYNGTTLTFTFEGGITETFSIHGKERAEEVLRQLGDSQRQIREAAEARDIETLMKLDPLFEVRVKDTWAVQAPRDEDMQQPAAQSIGALFAKGTILGVSGAAAALLALPMWHMRNVASDEAMFTNAKQVDREYEWEHYVREGKRHLDEARDEHLPRAALREAKEKGSVTALRDFLKKYPKSVVETEARDEIHTLFTKTLGEFREQASTDDPKLLPFMEKLLGYLEKNDTARLEARFEAPSTEKLDKVDELLKSKLGGEIAGGGNIVPVAPHFGEKVGVQREAEIVRSLQQGFEKVFPADVMALKQGPRIGPDGKPLAVQPKDDRDPYDRLRDAASSKDPAQMRAALAVLDARDGKIGKDPDAGNVEAPTIEVRYEVGWAGDFFTEDKGDRKFVGIVVDFHVVMKIPGQADKLEFDLPVQPPDHFTVDYTNPMYGIGGGPSEGRVYDVMAARAFDQLSDKMRRVFFKLGSKAYGPLDPDDLQQMAPEAPDSVLGGPDDKAPPPGKKPGTKL